MSEISNSTAAGRQTGAAGKRRTPITRRRPAIAFPERYRNRPALVRMAIYRVWDVAQENGFTRSTVALLQAILAAGVSPDSPYEPVFAKKKRLAEMADISEASVYRNLANLEAGGWIGRKKQTHLQDGTLDLSEIVITKQLAVVLGFVSDIEDNLPAPTDNNKQTVFTKTTANQSPEVHYFSSGQNTASNHEKLPAVAVENDDLRDGLQDGLLMYTEGVYPKASVNHQSTQQKFVRIDGRSVAVGLVWLISEKRLSYGQLFKLQTLAKKVPGQMLEDFINLKSDRIKQLKTTNDCYRFINNLIEQGLDAKYLVSQRDKRMHQVERVDQQKAAGQAREAWCRARHDQTFIDPITGTTYTINANHGLGIVGNNGKPTNRPSIKITGQFIKRIEEGRFIRFVPQVDCVTKEEGRAKVADLWKILNPRRMVH